MADLLDFKWGEPKNVATRNGPRILRKAPMEQRFWVMWNSNKAAMRANGYSCTLNGNVWEICHWSEPEVSEEEIAQQDEAIEQSRATDAAVSLPVGRLAQEAGMDFFGFQRAGVAWILDCAARGHGALLGDDMGVGKTIQIIGVINAKGARQVLIICPASMLLTWAKELHTWLSGDQRVHVVMAAKFSGFDEERFPGISDRVTVSREFPSDADIVVINYDMLRKFKTEINSKRWEICALDEGQYIKNAKSQRTKMVVGQKPWKDREFIPAIEADLRIVATGTPIKNRPVELYTQLNWLDPEAWGNRSFFEKRYCGAHMGAMGWFNKGATNLEELQRKLRSTLMIRRMKVDVLKDLPSKSRAVVSIQGSSQIQKLIERELDAYEHAKLEEQSGKMGVSVGELAKIRVQLGEAKVPYILSHVEEIEEKTIIMVRHKSVQKALAEALRKRGVVVYNGDMTASEKDAAMSAFQTDESIQFFVGTITSCGVGLTLTAASYVLFGELEWTPADISQAEDRAYRQGQKNAVTVQHLVFDRSLDDRMLVGILNKQKVIDRSLDKGDISAPKQLEKPELVLPALPTPKPTPSEKPTEALTAREVAMIHQGIRRLAAACDGARDQDGQGFNGVDTAFGHSLARANELTQKQALAGKRMIRKYKGQLGAVLTAEIWGD